MRMEVASEESKEYVLKQAKEWDVRFIRLWFTDILGFLKNVAITVEELEGALEEGVGFDGSSIEGFARVQESDLVAVPDPSTFALLPWRPREKAVARLFCDIRYPDGRPFPGDPRYILKRTLRRAAELGYTFYVGPELEYFYFRDAKRPSFLDSGSYFDFEDAATELKRETILALAEMGIMVEASHHEIAPSQHELDLRYDDALTMADNVMTVRAVVKEVAHRHGLYATFMPKPVYGMAGSGMHVHQSLFRGQENAFYDPKSPDRLSDTARHYIAGLLHHAPAITAITSQWVNSYKRLVPGFEAPVYVCWARGNRSTLIRVPEYHPGREQAVRIEYRSPDPACNPYLAFAVMLAAGLEGIERKYPIPEPMEDENIFEIGEEEMRARGIQMLPGSLLEALQFFEGSELIRETLGEHAFRAFLRNKKMEWNDYRTRVTDYELDRYLPIL
jgi:glutamine synthetase